MRMLIYVLATVLVLGVSSEAVAFTSIGNDWRASYDTACQTLMDAATDCTLCHTGGDTSLLNPYAEDIQFAKTDPGFVLWIDAIEHVDPDDSDGDGVINNVEILTDCTFPGDALSVPLGDHTWSQIKALFH